MPDQAQQSTRAAGTRSGHSLYRTLLGLTVAVLLAAWLPFSVLYISALTKHAASVASPTSASLTVNTAGGHQSPTPVVTRTS